LEDFISKSFWHQKEVMDPGIIYGGITTALAIVGGVWKLVSVLMSTNTRLVILEARQGLLWSLTEQRAVDALHHVTQPVFDDLLEKFRSKTLTVAERDQFIDRLEVLASEPLSVSTQLTIPAAEILLVSAKAGIEKREGLVDPSVLSVSKQAEINRDVKKAIAAEALIDKNTIAKKREREKNNPA
jgi:hypothetical protein